jgi:hypothetical protein
LEEQPSDILTCERQWFGMDHCEIGAHLVTAWNLPQEFVEITSQHHPAEAAGSNWNMLAIVRSSCLLADALGFYVAPVLDPPSYEDLLSRLPEQERNRLGTDKAAAAFRIASKINAIELT